ncbi:2-iminobutanoate/2-iminopropanoate deaminase [Streptohalobacillus salinus]|uniref:2-iminobutanoate/2-iminopropanoate deaminase n=1 Tax=Streptohalobacillus salinus TaxID=621096 RepID=A0A2V3WCV6_9BACI|nr:RidA family protein [Streptohalobacillus salinus]PXW92152.1 2-iminobutanoate/2-iminopropanoate deaminase [Streptohalobacillus salinus]
MKKEIQTKNAPQAIGPYSQAIDVGELLFISGQIPFDPVSMTVVGDDIERQTKQVMENLQAVCEEAGRTLDDVVKFTIYLTDLNDFNALNETYASFLTAPYPARATVEVAKLPKGVKVEIDAIVGRK